MLRGYIIMKAKFFISLVLIAAIMLFSMQLCTLIFGNKPVVTITSPTNNAIISGTTLVVSGTIFDIDGDQYKVKVWIEDTSIVGWDYSVTSGTFAVNLKLTNLVDCQNYNIIAEGYDANNNVSDKYIISVTYSSDGGSITNILSNGNFASFYDGYNGIYDTIDLITYYLNQPSGDYLDNWEFYIWEEFALDNKIKIDLDGYSLRYYSTQSDYDGNAKISIKQNINYTITDKTRIYIKFKINYFAGGTNNSEAPIKIRAGNKEYPAWIKLVASYSTGSGYNDNGVTCVSNLNIGNIYTYDFNIVEYSIESISPETVISFFEIFVNCWEFDVTIYEIRLYEGQ